MGTSSDICGLCSNYEKVRDTEALETTFNVELQHSSARRALRVLDGPGTRIARFKDGSGF